MRSLTLSITTFLFKDWMFPVDRMLACLLKKSVQICLESDRGGGDIADRLFGKRASESASR